MSEIVLRELTAHERARAFAHSTTSLTPYLDAVREMEGDVAYGIALNGVSARAVKVRLGKAARQLGLKLRFAPAPEDARELIVELQP